MTAEKTIWDLETVETFRFLFMSFDVREAKRLIAGKKCVPEIHRLAISEVESLLSRRHTNDAGVTTLTMGISVDWKRVEDDPSIDLSVPVILAHGRHGLIPIDGYHRIAKGFRLGVMDLPCVVLSEVDSEKIKF
jgi:hypothetical protein